MRRLALAIALSSGALACGDGEDSSDAAVAPGCEQEERAPSFELGMEALGANGYVATLQSSDPFPVARDDNTWVVSIDDGSGTPASGLTIDVNPRMPDHGHGTPIVATVTESAPGAYQLDPINLWMPGYWEVQLVLAMGTSSADSLSFKVCIDP